MSAYLQDELFEARQRSTVMKNMIRINITEIHRLKRELEHKQRELEHKQRHITNLQNEQCIVKKRIEYFEKEILKSVVENRSPQTPFEKKISNDTIAIFCADDVQRKFYTTVEEFVFGVYNHVKKIRNYQLKFVYNYEGGITALIAVWYPENYDVHPWSTDGWSVNTHEEISCKIAKAVIPFSVHELCTYLQQIGVTETTIRHVHKLLNNPVDKFQHGLSSTHILVAM